MITNEQGMIANFVQCSQFLPGDTEFGCGEWGATELAYATAPDVTNTTTPAEIDKVALRWYAQFFGNSSASNTSGTSIDQMHTMFQSFGYHWQDIPAISDTSNQNDDNARLRAALKANYPVCVTVTEASVFDTELGANPYGWTPQGTHIIVLCGIDANGDFLVIDYANVTGPLQGNNQVRQWPRHYKALDGLDVQWASIIQLSWLSSIPGDDPLQWPANFNGYHNPPAPEPVDSRGAQADITWKLTDAMLKAVYGGSALAQSGIRDMWLRAYMDGINCGPPMTPEAYSVNFGGETIKTQLFGHGLRIEFKNEKECFVYDYGNKVVYPKQD